MDDPHVQPPAARRPWRKRLLALFILLLVGGGCYWLFVPRGYHLVATYPGSDFKDGQMLLVRRDGIVTLADSGNYDSMDVHFFAWDGKQRWTFQIPVMVVNDTERLAQASAMAFSANGHYTAALMYSRHTLSIASWKDGRRVGTVMLPDAFRRAYVDDKAENFGLNVQDDGCSYCWTVTQPKPSVVLTEGDRIIASGQYQPHVKDSLCDVEVSPDGQALVANIRGASPTFEYAVIMQDGARLVLQYRYTASGIPGLFPRGAVYTNRMRYTEHGKDPRTGGWDNATGMLPTSQSDGPYALRDGILQAQKDKCRILIPSTGEYWNIKPCELPIQYQEGGTIFRSREYWNTIPGERPILLSGNGRALLIADTGTCGGDNGAQSNPLVRFLSRFAWFRQLCQQQMGTCQFTLYEAPGRARAAFTALIADDDNSSFLVGGKRVYSLGEVMQLSPDGHYLLLTGKINPNDPQSQCFIFER